MSMEPTKQDIHAIFKRLRSVPVNKQCFDCGALNPTWASVTYGVFLCIDCSATHRSLGVHLTFIRSTQLDTSWTWLQLRAMQVGGNANATAFFRQHGCSTRDSQQKYNSRAASMYREKLHSLALKAMKLHGTKLHVDSALQEVGSPPSDTKDKDFFEEHHDQMLSTNTSDTTPAITSGASLNGVTSEPVSISNGKNGTESLPKLGEGEGPKVDAALSMSPTEAIQKAEPRKVTIGARKPTGAKKSGLGAKKGGLGAQKVRTDFNAIEKDAMLRDREKEEYVSRQREQQAKTQEDTERKMASMKLAYKDMAVEEKKREAQMKNMDPKKREQMERLGMGFGGGGKGITHSAISDIQTIEQEAPVNTKSSYSDRFSSRSRDRDYDDDFEVIGGFHSGPPKYDSPFGRSNKRDDFDDWASSKDTKPSWDNTDRFEKKQSSFMEDIPSKKPDDDKGYVDNDQDMGRSRKNYTTSDNDEAQKKFGNAKAISSDAYFGKYDPDMETKQKLSKFEGSTSISSADFYGDGSGSSNRSRSNNYDYGNAGPDLAEIKEGVKQGVTKVAGKLSSLANGVMSSLQDNYG